MMNPNTKTFNSNPTIVFIDAGVDNAQQLLRGVIPNAKVFILDKTADGIEQISQVLGRYQNTDSVHIISHGAPGCLSLGNTQLSLDTLNHYIPQLQQWNATNLLLYGCNLAAGDAGEEFIAKLHALTGSEIAASKTLTGSAALGGNWELEVTTGQAELTAAFTPEVMTNYRGIFADPVLVKDIWSGISSSYPYGLTNLNGTLYFAAEDATTGYEFWKSDGTAAGTVLVKDIWSGTNPSYPSDLTNLNGTLYFQAGDATNSTELWKSDGTATGTVMVKDIWSGTSSSYAYNFTNVNGTLYFAATDATNGTELWKSDGTAAGTVLVKDIWSGTNASYPSNLTNVNGTLYFQAEDATNGTELWKSDGTAAGTVLVKDIYSGTGNSNPNELININGTLYFTAADAANGIELWKSDGTAAGTVLVKDIYSGTGGSYPSDLTNINGTLYFQANDATNGMELWKSDGTAAPTNIALSNNNINENVAANSTVGNFTTTDPDTGDTFTYSLVTGTGSTDNTAFTISSNQLKINASPNFEAKSSYAVRVRTTDAGGLFTEAPFTVTVTNVNEAPTALALSNSTINENVAANTAVGTFTSTDPDTGNTFTYSLVTGTGSTDNTAFTISSNQLKINASPNFEAKSSYSVRVRTTDAGGLFTEAPFTVTVTNVNEAPTALALSNSTINENVAPNSNVGTLTTTDPDTGDTFTYSLVTGTGSTDNSAFTIVGGQLNINASPDFEAKSSYSIRVKTTDAAGLSFEKELTITINNLDEFVYLTPNNDLFQGTASADQIDGLAGSDVLYGKAGNDTIDGGDGNDIVYGGDDDDLLRGGNGSDRLYGDGGNDELYGDAGNDILYGGNGDNLLDGGAGSDQVYGNTGIDTFVLAAGMGQDYIHKFEDGKDKIRLDGGLTFADLKITQSGTSTLIKELASGATLAALTNTSSTLIGSADFI